MKPAVYAVKTALRAARTELGVEDDMAAGHKEANFSQGWGIAALVVAMVVAAFVVAGSIHAKTYMPPTNPMTPGSEREAHGPAAGAEHAAPAAEPSAAH